LDHSVYCSKVNIKIKNQHLRHAKQHQIEFKATKSNYVKRFVPIMSGNVHYNSSITKRAYTAHRFRKQLVDVTSIEWQTRGVRNPMKMLDIGFLKNKLTSKFKYRKVWFYSLVFENWLRLFGDGFHVASFTTQLPTWQDK